MFGIDDALLGGLITLGTQLFGGAQASDAAAKKAAADAEEARKKRLQELFGMKSGSQMPAYNQQPISFGAPEYTQMLINQMMNRGG